MHALIQTETLWKCGWLLNIWKPYFQQYQISAKLQSTISNKWAKFLRLSQTLLLIQISAFIELRKFIILFPAFGCFFLIWNWFRKIRTVLKHLRSIWECFFRPSWTMIVKFYSFQLARTYGLFFIFLCQVLVIKNPCLRQQIDHPSDHPVYRQGCKDHPSLIIKPEQLLANLQFLSIKFPQLKCLFHRKAYHKKIHLGKP